MPFVVQVLNQTAELTWMGRAAELPLSYADGMIGCMPVFETKEKAEAFADGAYKIFEIVTTPPNAAVNPRSEAESA